ncbi:MAG: DUF3943 domain-containing protein [Longimicrobiales bacterium]
MDLDGVVDSDSTLVSFEAHPWLLARFGTLSQIGSGGGEDPDPPVPTEPDADDQVPATNAWGAERSFPLATVGMLAGNVVPWIYNEYPRGSGISQMNPRTWWRNFQEGMGWDDNNFSTNQFAHPYQGALYYNAARANGYSYWESFPFAVAGSLLWECCGETHLMSVNDWAATSIGGAGVGEMLYRASSMVLDNTATGSERGWREAGAFLLNPSRGLSRLIRGDINRVYENPEHPNDRIPDRLGNTLHLGSRTIGDGLFLSDGSSTGGFFELSMIYGSMFELDRNKPFDFFTLSTQINFGEKTALGRLAIRANLYHRDLKRTEGRLHKFLIVQNFDYDNNNTFEFGGQSVGALLLSNWQISDRVRIVTEVNGDWMIMGAVNSEFALVAEIPGVRERFREYDFGTGLGTRLGGHLSIGDLQVAEVEYRATWLTTLNGSNANGEDANHFVQQGTVRGKIPVTDNFGIGLDWSVFSRDSYFSAEDFDDVSQWSPQYRVYVTMETSR